MSLDLKKNNIVVKNVLRNFYHGSTGIELAKPSLAP